MVIQVLIWVWCHIRGKFQGKMLGIEGGRGVKSYLYFFFLFYISYRSIFPGFKKCSLTPLTREGSDFIDIWRLVIGVKNRLKIGQKYSVLTWNLKKLTFKTRLLLHSLIILLENLDKVTTQESKKLDLSRFLNFSFLTHCIAAVKLF